MPVARTWLDIMQRRNKSRFAPLYVFTCPMTFGLPVFVCVYLHKYPHMYISRADTQSRIVVFTYVYFHGLSNIFSSGHTSTGFSFVYSAMDAFFLWVDATCTFEHVVGFPFLLLCVRCTGKRRSRAQEFVLVRLCSLM